MKNFSLRKGVKDELIAIVAENASNLGRIRYELKKNKERLVAAL